MTVNAIDLPVLIPAAEYVRMSDEGQQFSIANQQAVIHEFARNNGFQVVKTFSDAGRSGLVIRRRQALVALLREVLGGRAGFKAILVYDVSRWGRFQDADEGAHYEFLCKQAGIPVHYCAEQFKNDASIPSSILKALKRTMAGEYSRELSAKVYEGQRRLSQLGFRMGGAPGYGLRRMLISADGRRKRILRRGEWKSVTTDRIHLVPGPKREVECVRRIFSMTVHERKKPREISDALNKERIPFMKNRPWNKLAIYRILRNPEYAGCCVWGRVSQRLHTKAIHLPRTQWQIKQGCYAPIVDETMFQKAQKIILRRCTRPRRSDAELLAKLQRVLGKYGKLNERIINRSRGAYHERTYWKRFGSLLRAYELVGYKVSPRLAKIIEHHKNLTVLRKELMSKLCQLFPGKIRTVRAPGMDNRLIEVDGRHYVSFFVCREFRTLGGKPRWMFRNRPREANNIALVCRADPEFKQLLSFHVLPPVGHSVRVYKQLQAKHPWLARGKELHELKEFYKAVIDIAERENTV